jgi:methionine salvage enolase-phosphatase E1
MTPWHSMPAWPGVSQSIKQIKAAGCDVFVYANGTARSQLDLCRLFGLGSNLLFRSELLGVLKLAPESHRRCDNWWK